MVDLHIEDKTEKIDQLLTSIEKSEGIVGFLAPHAIYVEYPTQYQDKKPPLEPLLAWVKINFSVDNPKQVAFQVQQKIFEEGTEGVFFATDTYNDYKHGKFDDIAEKYDVRKPVITDIKNRDGYDWVRGKKEPDSIEEIIQNSKKRKTDLSFVDSKLNEREVKEIRWLYEKTDMTLKDVSNHYPVSKSSVSSIVNKKTFTSVTGKQKPESYERERDY